MSQTSLVEQCKEDFSLLVEAGFIAINQADEQCALNLFRAAQLLRPDSTAPYIGFGYTALHKLELKEAINHLSKAAEKDPKDEVVKALLGFAHIMTEQDEGMSLGSDLLHSLASETEDKDIQELSDASEHVVDYIKKHRVSTPFDMKR